MKKRYLVCGYNKDNGYPLLSDITPTSAEQNQAANVIYHRQSSNVNTSLPNSVNNTVQNGSYVTQQMQSQIMEAQRSQSNLDNTMQ